LAGTTVAVPAITFDPYLTSDISSTITSQTEAQIKEFGFGLIQIGEEIMAFESLEYQDTALDYAFSEETSSSTTSTTLEPNGTLIRSGFITGLNGVHRGLLDTDIQDHAYGDTVWFLTATDPVFDSIDLPTGSINFRHRTHSATSSLPLASASVVAINSSDLERPLWPSRRSNLSIQGNTGASGHNVATGTSDITVAWINQPRNPTVNDPVTGNVPFTEILLQDDTFPGTFGGIPTAANETFDTDVKWEIESAVSPGSWSTVTTGSVGPATSGTLLHADLVTNQTWSGPFTVSRNMRVTVTSKNGSVQSFHKPVRYFSVDGN
jgi:hypothetical protein